MTNLPNLIERMERAEGPDEDLDFEILCLRDPRAIRTGPLPGDPKFTASIDAALTLVPEGANWMITRDGSRRFLAHANGFTAGCATPALALLAAALRARETSLQKVQTSQAADRG